MEMAHPRLPVTFFRLLVGAVNRWVRVYDYHDAEERVEMLREWYEGEENADQYEMPDVEGCTSNQGADLRFAGFEPSLKAGQTARIHRGHGRATDGLESTTAVSARRVLGGRCGGGVL